MKLHKKGKFITNGAPYYVYVSAVSGRHDLPSDARTFSWTSFAT